MVVYAIKIGKQYFKEYVYATKEDLRRYSGHSSLGGNLQEGDIINIVLSDTAERKETKRSIGNTISVIYQIEKLKDKKIEIIPIEN